MKNSALNCRRGYTLIEVLVTILFFAIGMLSLYRLHLAVIQSSTRAEQLVWATTVAEARMEALLALDYDSLASCETARTEGPCSVAWTVTPDEPVPDTKTVRVTVSWKDNKNVAHKLALESVKGN